PSNGQPTCACSHAINSTNFGLLVPSPAALGRLAKVVAGRMPTPSSPDEVLASFNLQKDVGVHVGTVIHVPLFAASQAAALGAAGVPPTPMGPTASLHVVGIEAAESEFPSGSTPSYDLYATQAFARTVLPRTA